jgi:spermidine synthase
MNVFAPDVPVVSEQAGTRYLHFDSPWIQGAMDLSDPQRLVLSYTEQMMAWLLFFEPPPDVVIGQLGLGAGSLTRFCHHHLPHPLVVVERNPAVVKVCAQYFRLPGRRLRVVEQDAQKWVCDRANSATLGVLMVDLYDTDALGPVCDSAQFYRGCAQTLTGPAMLSVNLFGKHESFEHNIRELSRAFEGRLLLLPPVEEGNQIVLAFKGPPISATRAELMQRAHWLEQRFGLPARRWARSIASIKNL